MLKGGEIPDNEQCLPRFQQTCSMHYLAPRKMIYFLEI